MQKHSKHTVFVTVSCEVLHRDLLVDLLLSQVEFLLQSGFVQGALFGLVHLQLLFRLELRSTLYNNTHPFKTASISKKNYTN